MGEPHLLDLGAIGLHLQVGRSNICWTCTSTAPWYAAELPGDLLGNAIIRPLVPADNLNIDRRGQPEVQHLADNIRRVEKEGDSGKGQVQVVPQFANVAFGGMVLSAVERNQDLGVERTDGPPLL